jgi:hypothetical protein
VAANAGNLNLWTAPLRDLPNREMESRRKKRKSAATLPPYGRMNGAEFDVLSGNESPLIFETWNASPIFPPRSGDLR